MVFPVRHQHQHFLPAVPGKHGERGAYGGGEVRPLHRQHPRAQRRGEVGEGVPVRGERALRVGFAGESYNAHPVVGKFIGYRAQQQAGVFQAAGFYVPRAH